MCRTGRYYAPPGIPVDIGPGATVAHLCVIHGVHVGSEALIANHATVLDGAVIGALHDRRGSAGGGRHSDSGRNAGNGAPAKVKGPIEGTGAEMWVNVNPQAYRDLAARHLAGLEPM